METIILCMYTLILLVIMEAVASIMFVGFPTVLTDIVYYVHYNKEKKWVVPAYFSLTFLLTGIFLVMHEVMLPLGWIAFLLAIVTPIADWYERRVW